MKRNKDIFICIALSVILSCCVNLLFSFHFPTTYVQCAIKTEHDVLATLYPGLGREYDAKKRVRRIIYADPLWQLVKFKIDLPFFRKFRVDFEGKNKSVLLGACTLAHDEFALDADRIDVLPVRPLTEAEIVQDGGRPVIRFTADAVAQARLTPNPARFLLRKIAPGFFACAVLAYPPCFAALALFRRKGRYAMPKAHWGLMACALIFWALTPCAFRAAKSRHLVVAVRNAEETSPIPAAAGGEAVSLRRADGLEIAGRLYGTEGAARAGILLLHGNYPKGQHLPLYPLLAQSLADRGFRVLTIDFAGFGLSQTPFASDEEMRFDLESETEAALAYLKARAKGGEKLCIIGHSLGCNPALWVGLRDPDVGGIVLIGPPRRVNDRFHSHHDIRDFWARTLSANIRRYGLAEPPSWYTPERMRDYFLEHDMARKLPELRGRRKPVCFLDGGEEPEEDLAYLRAYSGRVGAPCEHVTLDGANHTLNVGSTRYDPPVLRDAADILEDWCSRNESPGSRAKAAFENLLRRAFPFRTPERSLTRPSSSA